jgi:tetratricopeptide (TPR) repeat protein
MRLKRFLVAIALSMLSAGGIAAQTKQKVNGADARFAIRLGNQKFSQADYEAALNEYSRVGENAGETYAQSLYNQGVCYYELWRTAEATVFYRRAIAARTGRYPRAWYALGVALEDQGRLDEARDAYAQSINTSRGGYASAQFKLGVLSANEGDYSTAAVLLRKAASRAGEHVASSHNNLGVVLARVGRLAEAEREFELALKQSNGALEEAAQNLKLCRSMLSAPALNQVASLKLVRATPTLSK